MNNLLFSRMNRRDLLTRVAPLSVAGVMLGMDAPLAHANTLSPSRPALSGKDILRGRVWGFNGNGFPGRLYINSIDDNGNVQGKLFDQDGNRDLPLQQATWREDSRQLKFSRTLPNGEVQTFVGYLFDSSVRLETSIDYYALAGTFTGDRFEDPNRPGFGWYAFGVVYPIQ